MAGKRVRAGAVLAALAALSYGAFRNHASGPCLLGRSPCTGPRLPAGITIGSGYGREAARYRIETDGQIKRIAHMRPSASPQGVAIALARGLLFAIRSGHLVLIRGTEAIWRSRGRFSYLLDVRGVEVGTGALTFTYGDELYLAPLSGGERAIAADESPLGFTDGGFYTSRWGVLMLRSDTGAIVKTIARSPLGEDYFFSNRSLYFIDDGVLMRARGAAVERLVSLARLRLSTRSVWAQSLGSLIELEDARRLVILRSDGSLFASSPLRGSEYRAENEVTFQDIEPSPAAVAFILSTGQSTETVYVLRAGARRAAPRYRKQADLTGCAHWARLQWHNSWLLYSDVNGDLTVIDSTGSHRAIDLRIVVERLHVVSAAFTAYWSGEPPTV